MVVDVVRGKQRGGDKGGLPSAESVRRPQTQAEAVKMIELSQKLLELGLQFVGQQLSQEVSNLTFIDDCFCSGRDGICSWRLKIW